jgi:tetratricopeptide (TPR) repeat protein
VVAERVGLLLTKAEIRPDDGHDYTIEDHDEVIRVYPRDAMAFISRGKAYAARGQFERAIRDYDEAIRLDPGSVIALQMGGLAYRASGRFDRAIADLDEAARLNPANARLFQQLRPELAP